MRCAIFSLFFIFVFVGCGSPNQPSNLQDTVIIDPTERYARLTLKTPEGFDPELQALPIDTNRYGSTVVEDGTYIVSNKFFYLFRDKKLLKKLEFDKEHTLPTGKLMLLVNNTYLPIELQQGQVRTIQLANIAILAKSKSPELVVQRRKPTRGSITIKLGIKDETDRSHSVLVLPSEDVTAHLRANVHVEGDNYFEASIDFVDINKAGNYFFTKDDLLVKRQFIPAKSNLPDWLEHRAATEGEDFAPYKKWKAGHVFIRGKRGSGFYVPYNQDFYVGKNKCVSGYLLSALQKICDESTSNTANKEVYLSRIENNDNKTIDLRQVVRRDDRILITKIEPGYGLDVFPSEYRFVHYLDFYTTLEFDYTMEANQTLPVVIDQPSGTFKVMPPTFQEDLPVVHEHYSFTIRGEKADFEKRYHVPSKKYKLYYGSVPFELDLSEKTDETIHIGTIGVKGEGGTFNIEYKKPGSTSNWIKLNKYSDFKFGNAVHLPPGTYRLTTRYWDQVDEYMVDLKNQPDQVKMF